MKHSDILQSLLVLSIYVELCEMTKMFKQLSYEGTFEFDVARGANMFDLNQISTCMFTRFRFTGALCLLLDWQVLARLSWSNQQHRWAKSSQLKPRLSHNKHAKRVDHQWLNGLEQRSISLSRRRDTRWKPTQSHHNPTHPANTRCRSDESLVDVYVYIYIYI